MRRRLRLTVTFLALGLATTVAVAMALAVSLDVYQGKQAGADVYVDDEQWTLTRWDRPGAMTIKSARVRGLAWSPQQAAGAPDTPTAGDQHTAWASRSPDGGQEWLILDYATAVIPRRVDVYESYCPGALTRVTVFDAAGTEIEAWRGIDPTKVGHAGVGISKVPVTLDVPTQRVKLYLASDKVPGWNEIDAVGLVDDKAGVQWARRVQASSTYASGSYAGLPGTLAEAEALAPAWTGLRARTAALDEGAINHEERQVDARGWPMLALWSTKDASPPPPPPPPLLPGGAAAATELLDLSEPQGVYRLSPPPGSGSLPAMPAPPSVPGTVAEIPLRPIWSGLAIDTVVYGSAWWLLWVATVVPRRFFREVGRFRRGGCVACGYDLGYDFIKGCPECGWRRGSGGRA